MKWEENVRKVVPYVAGEQPNRPNMIKLNTNENPYGPCKQIKDILKENKFPIHKINNDLK